MNSKFMESYLKDLEDSKQAIIDLFERYNIDFCFIGGVIRNEYGTPRMTEDIDLLVSNSDKNKVAEIPIGYMRELTKGSLKFFSLHDPKTRVEIIYSGERAGNQDGIDYLDPKYVAKDHILYLSDFVMYKLSSGIYGKRYKDFADIQNIIRVQKLSYTYAKDQSFREDLMTKYEELWKETYLKEKREVELMGEQILFDKDGNKWLIEEGDKIIIDKSN